MTVMARVSGRLRVRAEEGGGGVEEGGGGVEEDEDRHVRAVSVRMTLRQGTQQSVCGCERS